MSIIKKPPFVSQVLRDSARNHDCTMQVAGVCNYDNSTTVLAHVNTDGGKMGGKSPDHSACFCCSACHAWLDGHHGSELDELFYTRRAIQRTHAVWFSPDGFYSTDNRHYTLVIKAV